MNNKLSMQQKFPEKMDYFMPLTENERKKSDVMPKSTTLFKDSMKRLFHNPLAVASIIILTLIVLIVVLAPLFCPYEYDTILKVDGVKDVTAKNLAPFEYSANELAAMEKGESFFPHIFGTDELCRDYFSRVVMGTRISFCVGVFASVIVMIIGTIYGSISGLSGGKVDMIMMRIVDVIMSMPDMLIVILLSVVLSSVLPKGGGIIGTLGPNMVSLFVVFGLLYWIGMARLVRGQILSIRENEYIQAARLIRTKKSRIIRKHIIPNCISIIFVSAALEVPAAIFTESFLSFVGLGVQAPMPSLGALANAARSGMAEYPYKLLFPAIMIALIVLSFNLLGDGLRDAFDPKSSK